MTYSSLEIRIKQYLPLGIIGILGLILIFYGRPINSYKIYYMGFFILFSLGMIYSGAAMYVMKVNVHRYDKKITEGKLSQKTGLVVIGFGVLTLLAFIVLFFLFW